MIPMVKLECQKCGREFTFSPQHFAVLGFKHMPKRCPACADVIQSRPSVVQERKLLNVYDKVEVVSLPCRWEEYKGSAKDVPSLRMTVKGSRYGASWEGRIDIFAPQPFAAGDIVSVREMEVTHLVKVVTSSRDTLHHGVVTTQKEVPLSFQEGDEVIRTRKYLVLEPCEGPATCRLVWATARTKTTLKGLGRQYRAKVQGAPIASWAIRGGVRSGRAHTVGVLAIVSKDHPLVVTTTGDIQEEVVYE